MADDTGFPVARFEAAYREGTPPWDIGTHQPEVEHFCAAGHLTGRVLDMGCGSGANARFLARLGRTVIGLDAVGLAIERARREAGRAGLAIEFMLADALSPVPVAAPMDAVLDCGLFHVFSDLDRATYVRVLHAALRPGGTLALLCFSDRETRPDGPRRISLTEMDAAFADGWTLVERRPARFVSLHHAGGAGAWACVWRRNAGASRHG